jgi:hypothetical protein
MAANEAQAQRPHRQEASTPHLPNDQNALTCKTQTWNIGSCSTNGSYRRTLTTVKDHTPNRSQPTTPNLEEIHSVGVAGEEVPIAADTTTDAEEEEDGTSQNSRP